MNYCVGHSNRKINKNCSRISRHLNYVYKNSSRSSLLDSDIYGLLKLVGPMVYRTNGVANRCCVGPMVCRTNGVSDHGVSDQWCVGPMVCRTNGVSDQWFVGPMVSHPVGYVVDGINKG